MIGMLLPATPQFRRKRGGPRKAGNTVPPVPTGLTLVSATYDSDTQTLRLVFDRPINAGGIVYEAFLVVDAQFLNQYLIPVDYSQFTANSVDLPLGPTEPASGSGVHVNVTEGNGIVAAADSEPWAGATNLSLPFP